MRFLLVALAAWAAETCSQRALSLRSARQQLSPLLQGWAAVSHASCAAKALQAAAASKLQEALAARSLQHALRAWSLTAAAERAARARGRAARAMGARVQRGLMSCMVQAWVECATRAGEEKRCAQGQGLAGEAPASEFTTSARGGAVAADACNEAEVGFDDPFEPPFMQYRGAVACAGGALWSPAPTVASPWVMGNVAPRCAEAWENERFAVAPSPLVAWHPALFLIAPYGG